MNRFLVEYYQQKKNRLDSMHRSRESIAAGNNQTTMKASQTDARNKIAQAILGQEGQDRRTRLMEEGADRRAGMQHANAMELANRNAEINRAADNRNLITQSILKGAPVTPGMENTYN